MPQNNAKIRQIASKDPMEGEEKKMDDIPSSVVSSYRSNPLSSAQQSSSSRSISNGTSDSTATASLNVNKQQPPFEPNAAARFAGNLARILLLDVPLIVTFALYLATIGLDRLGKDYLLPQLELQRFTPEKAETQLTYYHRVCSASDQSAHDTADFLVQANMTTDNVVDLMLTHGVTVIPDLLSAETATELREFILAENAVSKDLVYVIENENRWSFPITVDQHPSVTAALEEILNQQRLVDILEAVVGKNPAIIEFTAITAAYGAVEQYWHQDVVPDGNAAKYARNFIPSYSLFMPLQNVTAKMGATGICPGTHMCAEGCEEFCSETGFQVSGGANNWPMGSGAFVNQQTMHRGEAHDDPLAPHRVLFILTFAPRPQTLPKTVETRMIGVAGSYSLHWSQWGHTLADFQRPTVNMRQPWRTLRSLGIYKPSTMQWGWDFVTVSSCRIANEDNGFTGGDFEEFVEKGGFWWLPKQLHGYSSNETETSFAWVYFLQDTVSKCQDFCRLAHSGVLAAYAVCILIFAFGTRRRRSTWYWTISMRAIRILALHAVLLFVAWWASRRVIDSQWGHNIRMQRSFSLSKTLSLANELPATLPTELDVLIFEGMQSEYFGSYSRVLEVAHPGNKAWNELIASFATGYDGMSPALQELIRLSMLRFARQEHRRILGQNYDSNWAEVTQELAHWFCHKSLLQRSNRYVNSAIQSLDFLLSESRFGYWRDTSLHRKHVPEFVVALRDNILRFRIHESKRTLGGIPFTASREKQTFAVITPSLPVLPKVARVSFKLPSRSGIPPGKPFQEPYPGAWLQEKDVVEATFVGFDANEWYRAYITYASANRMAWDVEYEDGDEGTDLCRKCVRPYTPYAVQESLEIRFSEHEFATGRVLAVNHQDDTFDIELEDNGKVLPRVQAMDLRRRVVEPVQLTVHARVLAMFPGGGDEWYSGTIAKLNPDGTVAIQYDDGDYAPSVLRHQVDLS